MKSKFYFFALFVLFVLQGQSQWNLIDSTTFVGINSINFMNADTGFVHSSTLQITVDGGQSWDTAVVPFDGFINDIDFANANVGYAVGGAWFPFPGYYANSIMKTTDGGTTWDSVYGNFKGGVLKQVVALSATEFFAVGDLGILHSLDGGATLDTPAISNLPPMLERYSSIKFTNATTGYILGMVPTLIGESVINLYKTVDGGKQWQSIYADTTMGYQFDFVMDDVGNGMVAGNRGEIKTTTNGGLSWQTTNLTDTALFFWQVNEVDGNLYAIGENSNDTSSGVYYSADWGQSWQRQFSLNYFTDGVVDISLSKDGVGYFATWGKVYKNTKVISLPEPRHTGFELYPNPASDVVSIKLENSGAAEVYVYNSLGQRVMEFSSGGEAVLRFDVSLLKPGFYVVNVEQGEVSITKKFLKE